MAQKKSKTKKAEDTKKSVKSAAKTEKTGTTAPEKIGPRRSVDEYSEVMRNEASTDNSLMAYMPKPQRLMVDIQAENEQIILMLRQHPITQVKWFFVIAVLLLLPFLFGTSRIFNFLPVSYRFAGVLGWYLLSAGFAIETFLKWFFRVFIITDERIIDVDFISMMNKDVSTTKIDKIEDVTSLTSGFLSSMFDYGTIIIQTAATKQELMFESVPHPSKVTALLNDLIIEEELEKYEGRVN